MRPASFGHPFTPYPIQESFMREAYDAIDSGGIGIFESPTGTGKSLSLICASLTWLNAHLSGELDDQASTDAAAGKPLPACASASAQATAEPDWIEEAARDVKRQRREDDFRFAAEQRQKRLKRLQSARTVLGASQAWRGAAPADASAAAAALAADDAKLGCVSAPDALACYLVQDDPSADPALARAFDASDDEGERGAARVAAASSVGDADELAPVRPAVQIIYCSRTHSQLAQFIGEVRRTRFAASMSTVALGSRKQLCTHDAVARLGAAARVNDACQALQRSTDKGCPQLHPRSAPAQRTLRDTLLTSPLDLEEVQSLGGRLGCCSYYTARSAAVGAHVLLVPYSCLLHEQTRDALGIRLSSSVVILDEAHNLLEALNDVHSVALSLTQLRVAWAQLCRYLDRYERALSGPSRSSLTRLLRFVKALRDAVAPPAPTGAAPPAAPAAGCAVARVNTFLADCRIDHLNLWELLAFCQRTELARKVQGFVDAADAREAADAGVAARDQRSGAGAAASASYGVIAMLRALTAADADGRVLVQHAGTAAAAGGAGADARAEPSIKYLHLNPTVHLAPIVSQARAVLLAGGTMEPREQLVDALLAGAGEAGKRRLRVHSFGHVVPPANLIGLCVRAAAAAERPLQLVAAERGKEGVLDSVARALGHVRRSTPDGLIVFVPSFAYLAIAQARWLATGALRTELGAHGPVFEEPRDASELDATLSAYARAIRGTDAAVDRRARAPADPAAAAAATADSAAARGRATLLAVVGGKMSEGINFSDELGRCVVLVGLPYPNPKDPELVERMAFLNQAAARAPRAPTSTGGTPAQRYYEGLCMRAVNQSIGRVIRHAADFAAIVLLDARYSLPRVQGKLPAWIRQSLLDVGTAAEAATAMRAFFERHAAPRGGGGE